MKALLRRVERSAIRFPKGLDIGGILAQYAGVKQDGNSRLWIQSSHPIHVQDVLAVAQDRRECIQPGCDHRR
jgi:hypothetical protein